MEKNPYSMAKLGLERRESLQARRECGFYVKYFFIFLSLIQFLIILGLVLFMVYGRAQVGNDKYVQDLSANLEERRARVVALTEDNRRLQHQLGAAQNETRAIHRQLTLLNNSLKACNFEKVKLREQCQQNAVTFQKLSECSLSLKIFNMTHGVRINALENQLAAVELASKLQRENFARDSRDVQEKLKSIEREWQACQLDRVQGQKFRELEKRVLAELSPAQDQLKGAVERALAYPVQSCYHSDISQMKQACQDLQSSLQAQLGGLARRVDGAVGEATQLQRDKAACAQREREHQGQMQQAARELEICKSTCDTETGRLYGERQKLVGEKEALLQQLEQIKQACWKMHSASSLRPLLFGAASAGSPGGVSPLGNVGSLGRAGLPVGFSPPAAAASSGNPGAPGNPSSGRMGVPPQQNVATGGVGTPSSAGVPRNAAPLGTTGAQGNPGKLVRTRAEGEKLATQSQ